MTHVERPTAATQTAGHPRRAQVLDVLRHAGGPLGAAEIAERTGIHVNTARFHLDALVSDGTVSREVEQPTGPGRPRAVYAVRPGMDRGGIRSYRLLAEVLLSNLSAGQDAEQAATQAGHAWGGYLAGRPQPFQNITAGDAAARLTALLDGLGFAPEPGDASPVPEVIRLRHCPFLELAERYGQLVCRIHLGLMQGALAGLDAPLASTLEPFAEPDACLTRLERASAA